MKAGLLYASSHAHPAIGADFLHATRQIIYQHTNESLLQLVVESVGLGGHEKEVYEKAERMLVEKEVQVLVAFLDLKVLPILQPLFFSTDKLIIIVNAGANYPANWVPLSNCIFLGLQHAFLARLTASCFDKQKGPAGLVTDFYNAGYLHTAAMVNGWVQAGGSIAFNYVDRSKNENEFSLQELYGWLEQSPEVKQLLCLFDTKQAALFYQHLSAYPKASSLSLLVSPMMLEKDALTGIGSGFPFSIKGYAPWPGSPAIENGPSIKRESLFALLGMEVGMILCHVYDQYEAGMKETSHLVDQLVDVRIQSPRGELILDSDTHYYTAQVYEYQIAAGSNDIVITQKPHPEREWQQFTAEEIQGVVSGWTNTYLCY